jgi:hypothetical protein
MTQKRQVCDPYGGLFGLLRHRWSGDKFWKRTRQDDYIREVALDRDATRRSLSFAWLPSRAPAAAALAVGTIMAAQFFVQPLNAQRLDPARERAIQECMTLDRRESHDPYGRGLQHHYRACMAQHGQPK